VCVPTIDDRDQVVPAGTEIVQARRLAEHDQVVASPA
jgi:hypothetical protein